MAPAVRYQIMKNILSLLQAVTWEPMEEDVGTISTIDSQNAIVFRKVSIAEREDDIGHSGDVLPGIIVSCPRTDCEMDYEHGTNVLDQVAIRFLIQFIDRDNESKTSGVSTYWQWQEMCWAMFSESVESFEAFEPGSRGSLVSVRVKTVDSVDERYWVAHDAFVSGVELEFQVQFSRGLN